MANIELDLNLQTVPDSDERDAELAALVSEMGLNECEVDVVNEHGPGGGAQVVRVEGPREQVMKAVRWYCELANDPDGAESFAEQYLED